MTAQRSSAVASSTPMVDGLRCDPAAVGLDPGRCQRLLQALGEEVSRGRLPGGVALIARRGQVPVFEAFGQQDAARAVPMQRDSLFRIYSMTKPIVSVAVMQLAEQGRLRLTDTLGRHVRAFAATPVAVPQADGSVALQAPQREATVHDLLRHTAGLTYEFLGGAEVQRRYAQARIASRERSNAEFCETLASIPLMFEPGSVWEYSRATDVLGRVVEVVTGQALGEALQQLIFAPLGMHDTAFHVPPEQHHRIAEPLAHDPDGGLPMKVLDPRQVPRMQGGGGGLISSAADYARFLQMLLQRGQLDGVRLLAPHTVDFMTADHLGDIPIRGPVLMPGHGFGLGFAVQRAQGGSPLPGSPGLYFWGGIAGTTFFVDPARELFAILMIQAPNQRDEFRALFRQLVYAALVD